MMQLGLFIVLALPAPGAEMAAFEKQSRDYEARRSGELHLVYESHKAVARELDHLMAIVIGEREAYAAAPDSPNAQSQLLKWQSAIVAASKLTLEEETLWKKHHLGVKELEAVGVTRVIGRLGRGENPIQQKSPPFYEDQNHDEMMRARRDKIIEKYWREVPIFEKAVKAFTLQQERERRNRKLFWPILAIAAGALIAGVLWRRRSGGGRKIIARIAPPALPLVIAGNIEVKGFIGRGAMGEVYEAIDKTLGRRVALKRLRSELLASRTDLDRLLAEARVVASLTHPNLVAIYSVERHLGQVYLAFEFVDGTTLARTIEERGRLGWPEALRIFQSVCSALHYAHSHRIIHRDLKPANIMLAKSGEVKVMDFGIAHEAQKSISRLTRAAAWGTPPYMAPEQELGGVAAGVDLFALSVCLYEMLTGELPFKGPNFLAQKREGLYLPASGLVADLPKGIDTFFKSALAPEPSKRFPNAAALAAAAAAVS